MASASEKPSIPMAGPNLSPVVAASTSRVPIMGPVHENETRARVNAMKKMLSRPVVFSAWESIEFPHLSGSFISKAPKNEMANTTSSRKNIMLHTALVAMALRVSAPKMIEIAIPRTTYMTTIEAP